LRPKLTTRRARLAYAGAGASVLVIPATAIALNSTPVTDARGAGVPASTRSALDAYLSRHRLGYGDMLAVAGTASPGAAGQSVSLQFAPGASSTWRSLATAPLTPGGHFRLVARMRKSGLVRVVYSRATTPTGALTAAPSAAAALGGGAFEVAGQGSAPQRVHVFASLRTALGAPNVLAGQTVGLPGRLLPGVAGRDIRLQALTGGGWRTIAHARTGPAGRFRFQYAPADLGRRALRVRFGGDLLNARVSTLAGELTVYHPSVASWYDDAGGTACGFHAHFGVANRGLPCGTQVTFDEAGRIVTAVVDDRGPFISGRDWDLNQNTAAALGFSGVGTIWASS